MKIYKLIVLIVCLGLIMSGCIPGLEKPDLIITTLETTGSGFVGTDGGVKVPIRVVVKNQGDVEADIFKVSTAYMGSHGGPFEVGFEVPGQTTVYYNWYPYTSSPLAPGSEVTFVGNVLFIPNVRNETVSLWAIADSCGGDEFMPDYCRVDESDESNNESNIISVYLP
jgi:hypothetical protein